MYAPESELTMQSLKDESLFLFQQHLLLRETNLATADILAMILLSRMAT